MLGNNSKHKRTGKINEINIILLVDARVVQDSVMVVEGHEEE